MQKVFCFNGRNVFDAALVFQVHALERVYGHRQPFILESASHLFAEQRPSIEDEGIHVSARAKLFESALACGFNNILFPCLNREWVQGRQLYFVVLFLPRLMEWVILFSAVDALPRYLHGNLTECVRVANPCDFPPGEERLHSVEVFPDGSHTAWIAAFRVQFPQCGIPSLGSQCLIESGGLPGAFLAVIGPKSNCLTTSAVLHPGEPLRDFEPFAITCICGAIDALQPITGTKAGCLLCHFFATWRVFCDRMRLCHMVNNSRFSEGNKKNVQLGKTSCNLRKPGEAEWHSGGQGFEPPRLHHDELHFPLLLTRLPRAWSSPLFPQHIEIGRAHV